MLKQLMHSMSMSMVRNKAISIFFERIRRKDFVSVKGWLELKKGYGTYIDEAGNFIVFHEGILDLSESMRSSRSGKNNQQIAKMDDDERMSRRKDTSGDKNVSTSNTAIADMLEKELQGLIVSEGETNIYDSNINAKSNSSIKEVFSLPNVNDTREFMLRSWKVVVNVTPVVLTDLDDTTRRNIKRQVIGGDVKTLLTGRLEYFVLVKEEAVNGLQVFQSDKRPPCDVPALIGVDSKIRGGIPFLVPCSLDSPTVEKEQKLSGSAGLSRLVHILYLYSCK